MPSNKLKPLPYEEDKLTDAEGVSVNYKELDKNFLSVFFGNCELPITNEKSENIFDIFALLTKSYSLIELQRKKAKYKVWNHFFLI